MPYGLQQQRSFHLYRSVITAGAMVAVLLIAGLLYLSRPAPNNSQEGAASAEAKAYVRNLELSDVKMQATENFMKQQVVEIEGKIRNNGSRPLESVDIYCLFRGADGREIHREKLPIVQSKAAPLEPGETRPFRLPFDSLPDGWNQALPNMVIARITFGK
jgi:hypothetical protein